MQKNLVRVLKGVLIKLKNCGENDKERMKKIISKVFRLLMLIMFLLVLIFLFILNNTPKNNVVETLKKMDAIEKKNYMFIGNAEDHFDILRHKINYNDYQGIGGYLSVASDAFVFVNRKYLFIIENKTSKNHKEIKHENQLLIKNRLVVITNSLETAKNIISFKSNGKEDGKKLIREIDEIIRILSYLIIFYNKENNKIRT